MKTAEEWLKEWGPDSGHGANLYRLSTIRLEAALLDAMKRGAEKAAEIAHTNDLPDWYCGDECDNAVICSMQRIEKAILTASSQWTTEDLK